MKIVANPWVWTELTESMKPERKENTSVPIQYMTKGDKEYFPYSSWIKKGYVKRKENL